MYYYVSYRDHRLNIRSGMLKIGKTQKLYCDITAYLSKKHGGPIVIFSLTEVTKEDYEAWDNTVDNIATED